MLEIAMGIVLGSICFMIIKALLKDVLSAEIEFSEVINKIKKLNHSHREFISFDKESVN